MARRPWLDECRLRFARGLAWLDVLVEAEEVPRVVAVLQRDEPRVLLLAVGVADAVLRREVEVSGAGRIGPDRLAEFPVRGDDPVVVGRVGPRRDRVEEVVRVAVRERSRLVRHPSDAL